MNAETARKLRINKGWSMEVLAQKSNLCYATVYNFEHKRNGASDLTIKKIKNALGINKEKEGRKMKVVNKNSPWSEKIKLIREMKGLTQTALSQMTGITIPAIKKYEDGHVIPRGEDLRCLCKHLGLEYYEEDRKKEFNVESFLAFIREFESLKEENEKLRNELDSYKKSIQALKPLIDLVR